MEGRFTHKKPTPHKKTNRLLGRRRGEEKLEGVEGGKTTIRIYYMKSIFNKRKNI